MKKTSWYEKHFKIRLAVSELQNSSSHFNRTALYTLACINIGLFFDKGRKFG